MRYTVILEEREGSWGAYVPDLPGCVVAGETKAEVLQIIREAIELHLEGLKERGEAIPHPRSQSEVIEIDAA